MARAQAGLSGGTAAARGRLRVLAARGAARRAFRRVVQAAGRRRAGRPSGSGPGRGPRSRGVDRGHVVSARGQRSHAAAVSRSRDHRARVARSPASSVGHNARAPRAAGILEPACRAPQSGVRPRSHVHVALLDVRLDPQAGRDRGPPDVDSPRAGAAGPRRVTHRAELHVAARRRARRRGARRTRQPAGPTPLRHGDDRPTRQASARHGHRRSSCDNAPRSLGALVPTRGGRKNRERGLARPRLDRLWGGIRRRCDIRRPRSERIPRRRRSGPGCRVATLRVRGRHGR